MRARLVPPSTSIVYYSNVQRRSQPLQYVYHDVRVSAWWQEQCSVFSVVRSLLFSKQGGTLVTLMATCTHVPVHTAKLQKVKPLQDLTQFQIRILHSKTATRI